MATTLAFGTAVLLGVLARAPEPDEDVSAGCGPGVAKRRPAETLLIVPGAALQHSTPIGQARRRPLKDIAGGVEHAVRARSRRVAGHGGRAARSPLSAVEACRIPCATPWKAAAGDRARGRAVLRDRSRARETPGSGRPASRYRGSDGRWPQRTPRNHAG